MHKEELLLLPKCNKPLPPSESKLLSYQNKGFFEYLDSGKHPLANCVCDRKEHISHYVSASVPKGNSKHSCRLFWIALPANSH